MPDSANLGHVPFRALEPVISLPNEMGRFTRMPDQEVQRWMKVTSGVFAASLCVRMSDVRQDAVADVLMEYEDRWAAMCGKAGSMESVKADDRETLRTQRRDELGIVMGYADADAVLTTMKDALSF